MPANNPGSAKDYAALVALAKARIDHGFSRAGRHFKPEDAHARAAALLAGRVIALSNALVLLAQHDLANEALPVLRSLMEAAARLARLAEKDGARHAETFWKKSGELSWENLFAAGAAERVLRGEAFAEAFHAAEAAGRRHFLANWGAIPWSHAFGPASEEAAAPAELLRLTALAMAGALESLDLMWPERFDGAAEIFSRAAAPAQDAKDRG